MLKAKDSKYSLNLRVTNRSPLVKQQIILITILNALLQKRMYKRIFSYYSPSVQMSGVPTNVTILSIMGQSTHVFN